MQKTFQESQASNNQEVYEKDISLQTWAISYGKGKMTKCAEARLQEEEPGAMQNLTGRRTVP